MACLAGDGAVLKGARPVTPRRRRRRHAAALDVVATLVSSAVVTAQRDAVTMTIEAMPGVARATWTSRVEGL